MIRNEQKGLINIVLLTITLPVLILLGAAASSIIQLPLVKQQMNRAISQTFHELSWDSSSEAQVASGMSWCIINQGAGGGCPTCTCGMGFCNCSGAVESGNPADDPVKAYINALLRELTVGGVDTHGIGATRHNAEDVFIEVSVRNIIVHKKNGLRIGMEEIATDNSGTYGSMLANPGKPSDSLFNDNFTVADKHINVLTSQLGDGTFEKYLHIPIVMTHIAVKVNHKFKLPTGLRFGVSGAADYSILELVSFRTLPRVYRTSGPDLNTVPVI